LRNDSLIDVLTLIQYLAYWVGFGTIHTAMASTSFKQAIPASGRAYRVIYNIVNTITLIVLLSLTPSISAVAIQAFRTTSLKLIVFGLLFALGACIAMWGVLYWDIPGFLGLTVEGEELNTSGPYVFSRHPVYSGIMVMLLSLLFVQVSETTLSWLIGAGGYFYVGTYPEENKLERHFGKVYQEYKQDVARLYPHTIQHFRNLVT